MTPDKKTAEQILKEHSKGFSRLSFVFAVTESQLKFMKFWFSGAFFYRNDGGVWLIKRARPDKDFKKYLQSIMPFYK